MARRTLNRKDLRAASEAAERLEEEEEKASEDGEKKPAKKRATKAKTTKAATKPKTTRTRKPRTPKVTRQKVIWGVFNNSNQRVASFEYPKRTEAYALATKLMNDKKSTHFVQQVKEPWEEPEPEEEKEKKKK